MNHGLVQPYKQTTPSGAVRANPSYLPASTFAKVVVDLLGGSEPAVSIRRLQLAIDGLDDRQSQLKEALQALIRSSGRQVETFIASLELWFDAQMDRVSGSYKRWAKRWVIAVATVVVCVGGVDSIAIARTLYAEDTVRTAIVQAAEGTKLCPPTPTPRPAPRMPARPSRTSACRWAGRSRPGTTGVWSCSGSSSAC